MKQSLIGSGEPRTVLLIGNLTQEGVTTKVHALGYQYKNKLLTSSPTNWLRITDLIQKLRAANSLMATFVHFTPAAIFRAAHEDYETAWNLLLAQLAEIRAKVFVYEGNLVGQWLPSEYGLLDGPYSSRVSDAEADQTLRQLYNSGVEVMPYKRRRDLTLEIQHTLDAVEQGVFFRLYVPNGRLQAEQLASLLSLLESYLKNVEHVSFSYDRRATEHGKIYVFKSQDGSLDAEDLGNALARFENFMNLAESDAGKAVQILERMSISSAEAVQLVTRYAKNYQRLKLDIKHEYETKILQLRQRFESEALDLDRPGLVSTNPVQQPSNLLIAPFNTGQISLNVSNLSVRDSQVVNSELARIIHGDITYNREDGRLMSLFQEYSDGLESNALRTALEQLKDTSAPEEERQTAMHRLKGFLLKIGPKIGELTLEALLDYLVKIATRP